MLAFPSDIFRRSRSLSPRAVAASGSPAYGAEGESPSVYSTPGSMGGRRFGRQGSETVNELRANQMRELGARLEKQATDASLRARSAFGRRAASMQRSASQGHKTETGYMIDHAARDALARDRVAARIETRALKQEKFSRKHRKAKFLRNSEFQDRALGEELGHMEVKGELEYAASHQAFSTTMRGIVVEKVRDQARALESMGRRRRQAEREEAIVREREAYLKVHRERAANDKTVQEVRDALRRRNDKEKLDERIKERDEKERREKVRRRAEAKVLSMGLQDERHRSKLASEMTRSLSARVRPLPPPPPAAASPGRTISDTSYRRLLGGRVASRNDYMAAALTSPPSPVHSVRLELLAYRLPARSLSPAIRSPSICFR